MSATASNSNGARSTATNALNASSQPGGSFTSNLPLSIESLLANHANAPNPTHAALEQAIQERNALSAQNSQLWKLIEKQRTAYNTLMKENDRIRGERDNYKLKLMPMGVEHAKKREKDKERDRNLRAAVSSPSLASGPKDAPTDANAASFPPHNQSEASGRVSPMPPSGSDVPLRARSSRSRSDDTAPPRSPSHVPSSRSQDILSDRQWPSTTSPYSNPSAPLPPVVGPKRADSLPPDASLSPKSDSPSKRYPGQFDPTSNGTYIPTYSSAPSAQAVPPLQVTRKATNPFILENDVAISTQPMDQPPQSPSRPVINLNEPLQSPSHSHSLSQPVLTTASNSSSLSYSGHQSSFSLPQNDPPVNVKSLPPLSPQSRMSIPIEARQYMASMETPVPSPNPDQDPRTPVPIQQPEPAPEPKRIELPQHTTPTNLAPPDVATPPKRVSSAPENTAQHPSGQSTMSDFLDFETEDDGPEEEDAFVIPSRSAEKGKARIDEFPLPPSYSDPQAHAQAQAMALAQAQAHAQAQAKVHAQAQALQQVRGASRPDHLKVPPGLYDAQPSPTSSVDSSPVFNKPASFRALPLLAHDLPTTHIQVIQTTIRPNDRGKEVLSFVVSVDPGNGKENWRIEKLYSDVLGLDQRIRASVGKGVVKKIGSLPESKLWRDHAPAKADQRKAALESYLQSLINLPIKNKDEVIAFFTSDVVRDTQKPVARAGYREGYLTKRGKNFGGWKSRYFVLQGPVLEYYESRGGTHLGSIQITGAQIGRQQRGVDRTDGEKEYRHAFLVIESKKSPNGPHRHVLCAESDEERDAWVEELVRYVMGAYNEESDKSLGPSPIVTEGQTHSQSRNSTSSLDNVVSTSSTTRRLQRPPPAEEPPRREIAKGPAVPISQLPQAPGNAKLFNTPNLGDLKDSSPIKDSSVDGAVTRKAFPAGIDPPLSSSLPTSSPLDGNHGDLVEVPANPRSNSELGHYADMHAPGRPRHASPEGHRQRKSYHPTLQAVASSPSTERVSTPDQSTPTRGEPNGKVKISAPIGGTPIPPGYKFGKEAQAEATTAAGNDRKEKVKSRSFWNFTRPNDKTQPSAAVHVPRAVFGVTLEEAIDVAEIERLPAIVYRCIRYLEEKKADQEEGIYRLSGSSAVIKSLRDRFNTEGDVDLLASDEFWDPHAIAGLLKSFFRELPASILTRELHLRFLAVIDFVDPQERINELSLLIKALPPENYVLLRALTEHLIHIVQNSAVNRMTMRNVGIVFSPTLGIPAGVFSLMIGEFNRVFQVDDAQGGANQSTASMQQLQQHQQQTPRQSSYRPQAANANLAIVASPEDAPSDSDDSFAMDDSGGETTENGAADMESSTSTSPVQNTESSPDTPKSVSRASQLAANRGLNVATSDQGGGRLGRAAGLPMSPRPLHSPSTAAVQSLESIGASSQPQS